MDTAGRIQTERRIISRFVTDAIAAGYTVSVNNGEVTTVKKSVDLKTVMDAIQTTDEDILVLHFNDKRFGWVHMVYGNGGTDVIADYTTKLEGLMKGVQRLADWIDRGFLNDPPSHLGQ